MTLINKSPHRFNGIFALFLFVSGTAYAQESENPDSTVIAALIQSIHYGVPGSPAFEFLPEKPSEVTHIITPADFQSNFSNWFDGTRLRTGFAFDMRPSAVFGSVGSLTEYQQNPLRQIAWRSVLSVGTAPAAGETNDVLLSAGLRVSLIDKGDPRANKDYIAKLDKAYSEALRALPQPGFDASEAELIGRSQKASESKRVIEVRDSLTKANWNALKVDLGIAGMLRAASGDVTSNDSLAGDRFGLWGASAFPLPKLGGQFTISAKLSWAQTDSTNQETARHLAGARVRFFPTNWFAISGEAAQVWSRYSDMPELNEEWLHLAVVAEVQVPILGGWLGFAYGGATSRRENPGAKFSLHYAVYKTGLLKK